MRNLILKWLFLALAVMGASFVTQLLGLGFAADASSAGKFLQLLIGCAILAVLNATLGKILKLLTIPLNCLTLGIFSLVVNAIILWLTAMSGFGMKVSGSLADQFFGTFVASLIIGAITGFLGNFLKEKDETKE